jgi:hypothetical protein
LADDQGNEKLDGAPMPEDVKKRVEQIQRQHRGKIRWRITKHTAELAIRALETDVAHAGCSVPPRSGKSRRRKRFKRLL